MKVVKVNVENLNQEGGVFVTPLWVSAHDGNFDVFNEGEAASEALERLAEDGNTSVLESSFDATGNGVDGIIFGSDGVGGIVDPEEKASLNLSVDESTDRYFSFASMVIPSNDAFVGNEDSLSFELFDENGNFVGGEGFTVYGSDIYDAGTEVNTEQDAAFINQSGPNTGVDENGVVQSHNGYIDSEGNPGGTPVILGGTTAAGTTLTREAGDFTQNNFELLNFSFQVFDQQDGTEGNDVLRGGRDNDILNGGAGDDRIFGDRGNDEINAGEGNDLVRAGRGDDTLDGGAGDDRIFGDRGNDVINGGEGNDFIRAGRGDDIIDAGAGDDRVFGDRGSDIIDGGEGNNFIKAGRGDDSIEAGAGDDFIRAGRGDDSIDAGAGNDIVFGDRGNDTFVFKDGYDGLSIRRFKNGEDIIKLELEGVDSYADLIANADVSVNRVSTTYEFDSGDILSVYGRGSLGEEDFSFV